MGWREEAKKKASLEAVKHIKDGFTIGLGSGSTVAYAIQEIGKRIQQRKLRILGVPTSHQVMMLAVHCGIPITTLNEHPQLDLAIDGADQIDRHLDLIKGMGGALTREKIVASATKQFVIVADETKLTEKLGANCAVPVEVLPFALPTVMLKMQEKGGKPVLREAKGKVGPVVTDNGNFIVDVDFGHINAPKKLDSQLKSIPGIIETGLFVQMADIVYVGTRVGTVQKLESK
ncbi:ribose 5-phosphate isomerase A [Candidatus Bathyarchaeota archaeon]|nr:MAG: ribose 5-phosphate isomerase A [Candidatus Bathyarchaeota archaeon]